MLRLLTCCSNVFRVRVRGRGFVPNSCPLSLRMSLKCVPGPPCPGIQSLGAPKCPWDVEMCPRFLCPSKHVSVVRFVPTGSNTSPICP